MVIRKTIKISYFECRRIRTIPKNIRDVSTNASITTITIYLFKNYIPLYVKRYAVVEFIATINGTYDSPVFTAAILGWSKKEIRTKFIEL